MNGRLRAALRALRPSDRRAWGALVVVVLVVAVTVGGLSGLRVDTGIGSFLPDDRPELTALQDKANAFGGDPIVVLLESPQPRALLHDDQLTRVLNLEGELSRLPGVAKVYGPATVINQIAKSARGLLSQIVGRRDGLRQSAEAEARGRGLNDQQATEAGRAALVGFDQRYGSLIVSALPVGLPTLSNPRFVDSVVFGDGDQARPQWRAVVPGSSAIAILVRPAAELDQSGTARLVDDVQGRVAAAGLPTSRVTVSGVPAVTAELSKQARTEFPLLGALALLAVGALYVLVGWTARRRDRLRPLLAALAGTVLTLAAFGWVGRPVSLGVVAFLPILLGIGSDFPLYLAQPAQRRRVITAALAGAAAFAALAVSPLPFVQELGIALAVGIVAVTAVGVALRRWLDVLPPTEVGSAAAEPGRPPSLWIRLTALTVATSIAALGWLSLPSLSVEADPQTLAQGLPALEQAEYAERVVGAAGEMNVRLRGPDVTTPEALAWTRQAEAVVSAGFGDRLHPITTVSQLLSFLGPAPTAQQIQSALELLPPYLSSAVIQSDRRGSLLVLGIELQDLRDQQALLADLRVALPPPPPGYTADVVGLPVAAATAYEAVTDARVLTNLLAVAFAGLVLLIGLRERGDALRAVLAVLLAGGWVLGGTWLLSGTLNPLTVAIGALVAATGCEFTVMLADAHRRGNAWVVRSVLLAAGAAAAGYIVLAASALAVLREFGILLAAGVLTSCAAAAVVVRVLFPPRAVPAEPGADADRTRRDGTTGGAEAPTRDATMQEANR